MIPKVFLVTRLRPSVWHLERIHIGFLSGRPTSVPSLLNPRRCSGIACTTIHIYLSLDSILLLALAVAEHFLQSSLRWRQVRLGLFPVFAVVVEVINLFVHLFPHIGLPFTTEIRGEGLLFAFRSLLPSFVVLCQCLRRHLV